MDTYHGFVNQKTWSSVYIYIAIILSLFGTIQSLQSFHFDQNYYITWGNDHSRILDDGQTVQLSLDKQSGSGFASKHNYLFGTWTMNMKLVPGNSAGTVSTFYLSSDQNSPFHDEVDFEFLGNLDGKDYVLQTNVFAHGIGKREQRMKLWFDPTADFHRYSIVWNHNQILMYVDKTLVRVFKNNEAAGVPYPKSNPMTALASNWNGENWATDGGRIKIDWTKAPFTATYQGFGINACIADSAAIPPCATPSAGNLWDRPQYQTLNQHQLHQLKWVRKKHLIFDYCKVTIPRPPECALNP